MFSDPRKKLVPLKRDSDEKRWLESVEKNVENLWGRAEGSEDHLAPECGTLDQTEKALWGKIVVRHMVSPVVDLECGSEGC